VQEVNQAFKELNDQRYVDCLPNILDYSDFIKNIFSRCSEDIIHLIKSGELERDYTSECLSKKVGQSIGQIVDDAQFEQRLRQLRHIEMSRIALREFAGVDNIEQTMKNLSWLADALLSITTERHLAILENRYGEPISETNNKKAEFVVFAMGKLGGNELNFSSDIDLIFAYSDAGMNFL